MQRPVRNAVMPSVSTLAPGIYSEDPRLGIFLEALDEASFEPVCRSLAPQLMRFFRTRGCDKAACEELTQDVLFTVYRHAATLRERQTFRAWVFTIARNCLLQSFRSARRRVQLVGLEPKTMEAEFRHAPARQSDFADLIASLSAEEQEALTLRYIDGLEYREIAAVLQIPVGTAKWRVFNSKLKLAVEFQTERNR